jgi:peroxiredoxin
MQNIFSRGKRKSNGEDTSGGQDAQAPADRLEPGVLAPNFTLPATLGKQVELNNLRGKPVILAFYPADWSPVCGDQMVLYNEILPEFEQYGAHLLGISVDGIWSHRAFSEDRNLRFPLLSDFEPKGKVARAYGVYNDEKGTARRALFVIDSEGKIRWSYVSPPQINPGADGIIRALESMVAEQAAS